MEDKFSLIANWKLKEVIDLVEVVHLDSAEFVSEILGKLNLPIPTGCSYARSDTDIDWDKMPKHYKFNTDLMGWEERIKRAFQLSDLKQTEHLIITYGWKEPTVKIPAKLFYDDWEGFIASTVWQTLIFSEDYKLIMEVSRDYYLHSNFEILR